MPDLVIYERRGDVAWLTMNRPESRNALSREHVASIREAIERACADSDVRAVVLAGSDPVFCAGADIKQYQEVSDRQQVVNDGARLHDLLDYMSRCPRPIIARVQKAAFGGAIGLIAASDIAVAVEGTRFSLSEARLGIVPAVISPAVLHALGPRNTRQLMLRSEPFTPEEALKIGLIQEIVTEQELDATINDIVDQLRAGAPGALADIKRLLYAMVHTQMTSDTQREMILNLAASRRVSEEGQEGLQSFVEKRDPTWKSKVQV